MGGLGPDLFRLGEPVGVDGDAGIISLAGVEGTRVVTSFLFRPDGRFLLLRRSRHVGSFRGRWAGVSGFLEDPTPFDQAVREIREETGIPRSALGGARQGRPVYARTAGRLFVVTPFRFTVRRPAVALDWEHAEARWIAPRELARFRTVPRLAEALRSALRGERPKPGTPHR